jgi:uncharacterized protein (DUF58 family)
MRKNLLDPAIIANISKLSLKIKSPAKGVLTGVHKSVYYGSSIEFSEHKEYNQGDEIKFIDWKVFAKSDKYYVKKYEDETNLKCYILLDKSSSMKYKGSEFIQPSGEVLSGKEEGKEKKEEKESKFDYAAKLAATLSYTLLNQQDSVGLVTFNDEITKYVPPRSNMAHLHIILDELSTANEEGRTNLSHVLDELSEKIKGRGLIIIISDLLDEDENVIKHLKLFKSRKHDVIVFHLLHADEVNLPFDRLTLFEELETDGRELADPQLIRDEYTLQIEEFVRKFKRRSRENEIDYYFIDTDDPLDKVVIRFLFRRKRF